MTEKNQTIHEISELLSPHFTNSPLRDVFSTLNERSKYQAALAQALDAIGFNHFSHEVFIGEISDQGKICLFTRHASIVTKLKNKLPSLLHYFREGGFRVSEIRLRVLPKVKTNPSTESDVSTPITKITFTASQIKAWEDLLAQTDANLSTYEAIKQLIASAKRNLQQAQ